MAEKVPIRAVYSGSDTCGLSELQDGEVVGVEHGGLGACTFTTDGVLLGNTQSAVQVSSALTTNGQLLIGGTSGPAVANVSGTTNEVEITNGDGTITVGLPATVCVTTKIISPALCIGSQYVLPSADGSAGQVMCTDGSGALAFATNTPASPGGSDTYVQFNDGSSFGGSANFTWDDTTVKASNFCTAGTATLATVDINAGAIDGTIIGAASAAAITGAAITGTTITGSGNISFDGGTFIFNESGADKDFRIEGDTAANLFITDASVDRIGIGTATPSHLLDIEGVGHASTCFVSADLCATTKVVAAAICMGGGYALPTSDGTAGYILCTDGSGAVSFAEAQAGHTIAEDGSTLTDRTCLNFCGTAITVTDCSATNSTDVKVDATGACMPIRVTDGTQCYACLATATIAAPCLQCDSAPKLGGSLDVNGNSIISASNGNIPITPNGSGIVILDGLCHPTADGSAGQLLCTDGSAALKFATVAATSPGGSDTYVQFNNSSAFGGSANLTWDDTTFKGSNFCTAGTATLATVDINAGAIDGTTIGAASAAAITGAAIIGSSLCSSGNVIAAGTVEPAGDTAASDNAAIGYTATEGIIITGQGSTNDVTIKNDADTTVLSIPTGATGAAFAGTLSAVSITDTGTTTIATADINGGAIDGTVIGAASAAAITGAAIIGSSLCSSGTLTAGGNVSLDGGTFVFNESGVDLDFRIEGETKTNLFVTDASANRIGIGSTTPVTLLDINIGESNEDNLTLSSENNYNPKLVFIDNSNSISAGIEMDSGACSLRFFNNTLTSERMRIDSAGKVGIGTTVPDRELHVYAGDAAHASVTDFTSGLTVESGGSTGIVIATPADSENKIYFADPGSQRAGSIVYSHVTNALTFGTAGADRVVIDSAGDVGIGTMSPDYPLHVMADSATWASEIRQLNTQPHGLTLYWPNGNPDNNTKIFFNAQSSGGQKAIIYSDGDMANHDGVYGTISDVKFKQDIEDARRYWDDFKQLQYRKWRDIVDVEINPDAPYRMGLVAQEVEPIFPALVAESLDDPMNDDDSPTHKWVRSSIIEGPIMASVVQELQTRLEAAEAEIAILKG